MFASETFLFCQIMLLIYLMWKDYARNLRNVISIYLDSTAPEILKLQSVFLYNIGSLNDFIGQKCLKLKLRSAFVPTWSWIFIKNVGLKWYQWIPDFYNIWFWANLFNGKKLCGLKSYVIKIKESIDIIVILQFYEKWTSRWYEGWSQL